MTPKSDEPKISFAARLSASYAAFFFVAGIHMPFFPVWLKAKGLDPGTIGLVLAMPMLLRMLAIPLATRQADRRDALRGTIMVMSCLSVAGYALVGLADGATAILIAYAIAALAFTPVMPLSETYAFKGLAARGRAYGPVRLWGSLTFILGTFAGGFFADSIPARYLIWLIVAASALNACAALGLAPLNTHTGGASQTPAPHKPLLRDPAFLAVLAGSSLIQASHAVFYGFSALEWRSAGLEGTTVAALWGLGVVAEIVLFAYSGRLPAFFQPIVLLMIGAVGATLRWTGMALDPAAIWLPWLQLLHALSFGATHLGAVTYLARNTPAGQGATAQGYLAIVQGAALAGATALSGVLYAAFGSRAYAAMALAAIAGGACALIAQRARRGAAL